MLPFDEAGSGPAVVLVHAGIADRSMWSAHLQPLAGAGYRALAFDLPGFGDAPVAPGPQAPWEDLLGSLDELGIGDAALVGNSFGGAVALRVAVVAPARVRALAMVSAPVDEVEISDRLRAVWTAEEEALERGDVDAAVAAVVDAWTLRDSPPELRERVGAMYRHGIEVQLAAEEPEEAPDPVEEDPDWPARVTMPVLLAAGERDMPDMQEGVHVLGGRLPHARCEFIAGAGHLAPLETPDAFRSLVLDFLVASG
jgi:pimeloyl-ACP methyl ester carboxylesterase